MAINGALVTPKKQQQTQVNVRTIFFVYSCLYFYVLTTILKSSVMCKNGIETCDNSCTEFGPPVNQLS